MIKPHGSKQLTPLYVEDAGQRKALEKEALELPILTLNSAAAANAVMLGAGYFSPLFGYMNLADAISVADQMRTTDGLFWPVPIMNRTDDISEIKNAHRIALLDPNVAGTPVLAVQNVDKIEEIPDELLERMAEQTFGTTDTAHPGVETFIKSGKYVVSGPIQVLNFSYFEKDFPGTFRTAYQIREMIQNNNWETVVAFQTRNPMHRA
ncbi:MAG: sulfate adenylyltransferase, partial [Thiotrichales bacterium]|nr:sulfate adenylyltransferase [Thiotrichales bacterium]